MANEKEKPELLTQFAIWCIVSQGEASSASEPTYKYDLWEHTCCFNQMQKKMQKQGQISSDLNN